MFGSCILGFCADTTGATSDIIKLGQWQGCSIFNFFHSMYYGKKAEKNPWNSNTLEWTAPVEHIHGNWPGKIPEVFRWAYDYSKPGKNKDFVPQSTPIAKGEKITEH